VNWDVKEPAEAHAEDAEGQPTPEPAQPRGPVLAPMEPPPKTKPNARIWRTIIEIVVILVAALVIALLVQAFIIKPFTIHQVSMRATLEEGDRVLINRLTYHFRDPARGDVIVFRSPIDPSEDLVKRIVAIPGDRIAVGEGKFWLNGVAQTEPYLLEQYINDGVREMEIPAGCVFVMGDNRNNSTDSRMFGVISREVIIGSALVVYWPLGHWKTL
jgi:signal peptidase I